jgi:hypothetical protein
MSSSGGSSASEFSRELSAVTVPWGDVPRPLAAALEPCRLFSVEGKGLCLVFLVLGLTVVGCFRFDITTTQYEGGSGKERRLRYYPRCGVYLFFFGRCHRTGFSTQPFFGDWAGSSLYSIVDTPHLPLPLWTL